MVSYKTKRFIVRTRKAFRPIKTQFDRFTSIAKKENVKSRFFMEYAAYQKLEKRVREHDKKVDNSEIGVTPKISNEIAKIEILEENQLLKDYDSIGEYLAKSRTKFNRLFLASYVTMCFDVCAKLYKFAHDAFADGMLRHAGEFAISGAIVAIAALLYKAVGRYYKAMEKMQGIAMKHRILRYPSPKEIPGMETDAAQEQPAP